MDIGELAESHRRGTFDNDSLDRSGATRPPRMNRYQREVAEMDLRRVRQMRVLTLLGAAAVMASALWASGVRIEAFEFAPWRQSVRDWWQRDWFPEKDERYAVAPQLPTPPATDQTTPAPQSMLPGTDSSVSKIPLAFVLVSTAPGRNTREGTARIGTHPENPQTYAAGALLANGSRLVEIHEDHVVLERDGKRAKLHRGAGNEQASDRLTLVGSEFSETPPPVVPTYSEALTDYVRPSPIYEGSILRGYQVYPGQRSGIFAQLGLQNGDVLISLNDQPLSEPQQAMDLLSQMMSGVAVIATIERNGSRERVSLDGRLIAEDQERSRQAAPVASPSMPLPQL